MSIEYRKATRLVDEEQYRDALSLLETYLKSDPGFDSAWFYSGICRFRTSDTRGAIKDFTKAIELSPRFYEAYNIRGLCHGILGQYDKEMEDYNKAIEIWPDFHKAWYNRGNLKYDRRDLTGALNDYTQAIRFNPGYGKAHFNRANVLDELERYEEALSDYYTALKAFDSQEQGEIWYHIAIDRLNIHDTLRACLALDSASLLGYTKADGEKKRLCLKTK